MNPILYGITMIVASWLAYVASLIFYVIFFSFILGLVLLPFVVAYKIVKYFRKMA